MSAVAAGPVRAIHRRGRNVLVRLYRMVSPAERAFWRVFPEIDSIEGFLRSPQQERWLFNAARSLPTGATVVEIGSFKGRSTGCLGHGCARRGGKVYAIDLFRGDGVDYPDRDFLPEFLENVARCGLRAVVEPLRGSSREIGRFWSLPIHLLFIDGSHGFDDALADFEAFFPFVVPGGMIAFHDVGPEEPGVVRVWREEAAPRLKRLGRCSSLAFGRKPGRARGFRLCAEELIYRTAPPPPARGEG